MTRDVIRVRLWLAALACGGIAGAHRLAYYLSTPHHDLEETLVSTGHDYWPYFSPLAMALLLMGLGRHFLRGYREGRGQTRFWTTASSLFVVQAAGFAALEVAERMFFAPDHSPNVLTEPVFWWGLALQAVTAVISAVAIRIVARAGGLVRRLRLGHRSRSEPSLVRLTSQLALAPASPATGSRSLRAPPTLS